MAIHVLRNATIVVNSVDLSDHCSSVTIETSFDEAEAPTFGATYRTRLQGLGDANITAHFHQDYAAGSVDTTLWPLSQSGATFPVVVKPTSSAVSATNPSYTMTAVLTSYNPIDGEVGDVSGTDVTFTNASQSGIARATS
jgi:hypothetical protein